MFHKTRAVSGLYWSPDSRFVAYRHQDFFGTLDVELYHFIIRRLADGSEFSVEEPENGELGQWVENPLLIKWIEAQPEKRP